MKEKLRSIVFHNKKGWRQWLKVNHNRKSEVWLVLPKKSAGGDSYRVYYNQALEEALCFGWIDSRIKPLDSKRSLVRFTPRKSNNWSRYNIDRALGLVGKKKMTKAGLRVLPPDLISSIEKEKNGNWVKDDSLFPDRYLTREASIIPSRIGRILDK
ncbi:MAG TPA: hypothetical protein VNA15_06640 [Candidatus Angelobacter sp.]|nr:hypothetical protein [Candidatus Angelobacter sp.]